jgi:uncharacterized RDD family membrane protein YckC
MSAITLLDSNNAPTGPFTRAQVADKLQRGEVTLSSLAFVEGLAQWTPLGDVLKQVDAANPPPPPVTAPVVAAPLAPTPGYSYAATMEPPAHIVYAGFWLRLVAYIIDGIIIDIAVFGVAFVLGIVFGLAMGFTGHASDLHGADSSTASAVSAMLGAVIYILAIAAVWLYFALMESSAWQGTVGKKILGLKVTTMEGHRLGFGQATGRFFAKILSGLTLFIGYIMAGFTARKQALHDMIASTLVVRG